MEYRDFILDIQYIYNDHKVDAFYWHKEDEKAYIAHRKMVSEIKKEIDVLIYEKTEIRVEHSKSLEAASFTWYSEAIDFCKFWNIPYDAIKFFFRGQEVTFDAP
jgi:hypothetical protein